MSATSAPAAPVGETPTVPPPAKTGKKAQLKGRSCWDITKLVTKILTGLFLFGCGVVALAALITGIVLIINPTGFGVGNFLGTVVSAFGAKLGLAVTSATILFAKNAVTITIVSAVVLGATGAAAAAWTAIVVSCSKKKEEEGGGDSTPRGVKAKPEELVSDDEDEDPTVTSCLKPQIAS